jgi:hypothetical protein
VVTERVVALTLSEPPGDVTIGRQPPSRQPA